MSLFPWGIASLPEPVIPLADTFESFLELRWDELTDDRARVHFEVRDDLRQPLGLLHGGIYCSVAETVASVATARVVWREGMTASGLSNSASFLRPTFSGIVSVTARRRHHDEREWLWSHEFLDDRARLCAIVDVRIAVRARA